ncbi:MAG: glycoside hydrolase family 15 [Firmicutes bacterium HGW-Firmicutes-14]|nr:MAG: glycoside hydrolase family 15 [Firmicutes bacterium HGW-Firmicutes-14]
MPRDIVLGNGSMLVNFDRGMNMRDLFYPRVGLDNHILGNRNRIGIWVDERFAWLDDQSWSRDAGYEKDALISRVQALNKGFSLSLSMRGAVHFRKNLYLMRIDVTNLDHCSREVRLFFTHDLSINETDIGDTALFDPTRRCIYHYKRDRYFLINGRTAREDGSIGEEGIFEYSVGTKRFKGAEGTWRDAEDGNLEHNTVAHGSIDSTVSLRVRPEAGETVAVYYWIIAGRNIKEVRRENEFILENGAERVFNEISGYWRAWVRRKERDFFDLSPEAVDMFFRSLLIIRTQTDNKGAILAANDSDVLLYHRDHYSYMWPRDGALVAYALDIAGYPELTMKFFRFCADIITEGGFFLHKYNSDGTLGSSWHPWWQDGQSQLPIQEDETALVLFALGKHYALYRNVDFIESLYQDLITKAGDFLVSYRDPSTKLPFPSFDLWEERRGIFTFTCSAVYAALSSAASLAFLLNDRSACEKYSQAAQETREAMEKYLYNPELGRFLRGIYPKEDGSLIPDSTLDSSLYGIFEFGAFSPADRRVTGTMKAVMDGLWVKTDVGGTARYTDDYYFRKSHDLETVPGNPWVICTLWMAEYLAETASVKEDLARCREIIEWAVRYALPSGVLPEQVHPFTGEDLSVSPLTWSHSTYVLAVEKYLKGVYRIRGKNNLPVE